MPPKPIDNERRACDAVARVLEERHGATRANASSPEDNRVGPPMVRFSSKGWGTELIQATNASQSLKICRRSGSFLAFRLRVSWIRNANSSGR